MMVHRSLLALALAAALVGCTSPEATRTRGGGPGADVANRTATVEMHEGSKPYWETPQIIAARQPPPSESQRASRTK
jgi:hypothetical protein